MLGTQVVSAEQLDTWQVRVVLLASPLPIARLLDIPLLRCAMQVSRWHSAAPWDTR